MKRTMARAAWRSSLSSCRTARSDHSTRNTSRVPSQQLLGRDGPPPGAEVLIEGFFRQVGVLEILEVLEDRLASVERLGASGLARQCVEACLDLGRESQ